MESEASHPNDEQRAAVRQTTSALTVRFTGRATKNYGSSVSNRLLPSVRLREFAGVLVYVVLLVSACGGINEESSGHSISGMDSVPCPVN